MKPLSQITHDEALQVAALLMPGAFISKPSGWMVRPLGEALGPNRANDWNGLMVSHQRSDFYLIIDFDANDITINNITINNHIFPEEEKIDIKLAWKLFQLLSELGIELSFQKKTALVA